MKVGIIQCEAIRKSCVADRCMKSAREKSGSFEKYDTVELVGMLTCGGCPAKRNDDNFLSKVEILKKQGADVIHFGNCIDGFCPYRINRKKTVEEKLGLHVEMGTHNPGAGRLHDLEARATRRNGDA
jgi:predicted metal-binding protein